MHISSNILVMFNVLGALLACPRYTVSFSLHIHEYTWLQAVYILETCTEYVVKPTVKNHLTCIYVSPRCSQNLQFSVTD